MVDILNKNITSPLGNIISRGLLFLKVLQSTLSNISLDWSTFVLYFTKIKKGSEMYQ